MSDWDEKLLKYGQLFESELMDLSVNISLEDALDLGWKILAECFDKTETGIKSDMIDEFWPKDALCVREKESRNESTNLSAIYIVRLCFFFSASCKL